MTDSGDLLGTHGESTETQLPIQIVGVEHTLESVSVLAEQLRHSAPDCLLIESVGGTEEERDMYTTLLNAIVEGQYTDEEIKELLRTSDDTSMFSLHLAAGLRGTDVLLLPIDIQADPTDPVWQMQQDELALEAQLANARANGDSIKASLLEERLKSLRLALYPLREQKMAEQITQTANRIAKTFGPDQKVAAIVGQKHAASLQQLLEA